MGECFYEMAANQGQIKEHIYHCPFLAHGNINDLHGLFKDQTIASQFK
jgi:hypothetical protein